MMYKTELVRRVAKNVRVTQGVAAEVLTASLKLIQEALGEGQKVVIPGFGSFYTRKRGASKARDFKTQKVVEVPAMRIPAFRPGSLLKRAARRKRGKK